MFSMLHASGNCCICWSNLALAAAISGRNDFKQSTTATHIDWLCFTAHTAKLTYITCQCQPAAVLETGKWLNWKLVNCTCCNWTYAQYQCVYYAAESVEKRAYKKSLSLSRCSTLTKSVMMSVTMLRNEMEPEVNNTWSVLVGYQTDVKCYQTYCR